MPVYANLNSYVNSFSHLRTFSLISKFPFVINGKKNQHFFLSLLITLVVSSSYWDDLSLPELLLGLEGLLVVSLCIKV